MKYSPSNNTFYAEEHEEYYVSTGFWPDDLIDISQDEYESVMASHYSGKKIKPSADGRPITVDPDPSPIVAPSQVTKAQGKAALISAGLWQGVLDYVASIEDETEKALAELAIHDTTHWQRTSTFLNSAVTALGLTQEQLDELFIAASKIEL